MYVSIDQSMIMFKIGYNLITSNRLIRFGNLDYTFVPGIPSDSCKKSRSLVLAKAALAGQLSSRSSQNSQYEKEMDEDDEEEEESTQESKTKGKSTDRCV